MAKAIADWKRQMVDLLAGLPEEGLRVERNAVGNLSVLAGNDEWVGYIDLMNPEESQLR